MEAYEATRVVFSKIQALDPENASKIMGLLLIQDLGEKEMIRLAFGPENLLHSLIVNARNDLGVSPNPTRDFSILIPQNSSHLSDYHNPEDLLNSNSPYHAQASRELLSASSFPPYGHPHRRSYSVNDAFFGSDDGTSGFGWKPCLYYTRGFCKNETSCRFLHGGFGDNSLNMVGSENTDMLRSRYSQRAADVALLIGEDMNKSGRTCLTGMVTPNSRQIYLTFPADSTFREEDVSNYFSMYGPVQDVRIPYQQRRMFGFVTFLYSDTVRIILAKGNPHFVCDSRVLVKPYKEKGKVPDRYRRQQQQQMTACCWSKLNEQKAIEIQARRLMALQLLNVNNPYRHLHNINTMIAPQPLHENCSSPGKESPLDDFNEESFGHNLPDSLFASPKKSSGDYVTGFSNGAKESNPEAEGSLENGDSISSSLILASSTISSHKSCYFPLPSFSPSQETIGV